jgi:hypothetical protein
MADRSAGRTVGFILFLVLAGFVLLAALITTTVAENSASGVYDDTSPHTSGSRCSGTSSNSQQFWDCVATARGNDEGRVAEYNAQVAARQADVEAASNTGIALAVIGLALAVCGLAFNVSRSAGRGATGARHVPAHTPAGGPPAPMPGPQPGPWQGNAYPANPQDGPPRP